MSTTNTASYALNQVCMPYEYFTLFIVIAVGVIVWALYQVKQQSLQIQELLKTKDRSKDANRSTMNQLLRWLVDLKSTPPMIHINQSTEKPWNGPTVPPVQRINVPTRGEYGPFQQVGYAYKPNDVDVLFQLYGRRLYSDKYEYYVLHPYSQIKMPVKVRNDRELNNDEHIHIPGFTGEFKVEMYDIEAPRYIPY